ncbi:MAG: 50S ribosomal protein L24 [Casimicrobiaceae bacterium]
MAAKIKKGDKVVILAGKDRGKSGTVLAVFPTEERATVQGLNLHRRHTKQTASSDAGIFTRESPIHLSNLALVDSKGKPTRVGFKTQDGGKKVRVARTTGEVIDA